MHSYLVDRDIGRGRLLHSASLFREAATTTERNFVGRANRYLHFAAMKYFRSLGLRDYDLGGYAPGAEDAEMASIAQFKRGFGGVTVREDRLVPVSIATLQFGRKLAARAAQRIRKLRFGRRSQATHRANRGHADKSTPEAAASVPKG